MKANKKKANYSIHNVLKSTFYHKQGYHTCELQCFVLHVCCKNVRILIYTKYSHCNHHKETNFGFFFHFPCEGLSICIDWVNYFLALSLTKTMSKRKTKVYLRLLYMQNPYNKTWFVEVKTVQRWRDTMIIKLLNVELERETKIQVLLMSIILLPF